MPIRLPKAPGAGPRSPKTGLKIAVSDGSGADESIVRPAVKFTRAAGVLELAREGDPAMARALREPHVALDAYGRILGISPAVSACLGFANARLIGRRLQNRVIAADRARFQIALVAARTAPPSSETELRFRSRDDRIVDAVLTPVATAKAGAAVVIVFRVALEGLVEARKESRAAAS